MGYNMNNPNLISSLFHGSFLRNLLSETKDKQGKQPSFVFIATGHSKEGFSGGHFDFSSTAKILKPSNSDEAIETITLADTEIFKTLLILVQDQW